jgi:ubiquinone/menaquinone biosynthesis C-methylase UbiE
VTEPVWIAETRASYDTVAEDYAALLADHLAEEPVQRHVLSLFADLVRSRGGGRVLDLGCGTGRLTGHLRDLGLDVEGLDLSPGMLAMARRAHPDIVFTVGTATDLPYPDGSQGGVVAFHSLIHVPDEQLGRAVAEIARVLRPGGTCLVTFHIGDSVLRKTEGYGGHPMSLDVHRRPLQRMADELHAHGLRVELQVEHRLDDTSRSPQGLVVAVRSG